MGKKIDKQGTGIIYKRTSPSGKSYIGKTFLQEQERWKQHVSEANRGEKLTKLNKAIKKYGGENFSVEILESCLEEPELSEREKYYISYYDTYKNGYNSTLGGEGSAQYDDEEILFYWRQGKTVAEIARLMGRNYEWMLLRARAIIPQEEIQFRGAQRVQELKYIPEETREALFSLWQAGKSQLDISKKLNISSATVSRYLRNAGYTTKELKAHGNIASANKRKQPVLQYSLDGILLREWPSVSEAERFLQISGGHISEVCKHRKGRLTAGGYRWEYKNGQEN